MKFRKGDEILVTAGKDKGRKGKIEKIFPKRGRVLIANVNVYKKHIKKTSREPGTVVEISRPLPVANIALVCPVCQKQTRIAYRVEKDNQKTRICAKCKRQIDVKKEAKKS